MGRQNGAAAFISGFTTARHFEASTNHKIAGIAKEVFSLCTLTSVICFLELKRRRKLK